VHFTAFCLGGPFFSRTRCTSTQYIAKKARFSARRRLQKITDTQTQASPATSQKCRRRAALAVGLGDRKFRLSQ